MGKIIFQAIKVGRGRNAPQKRFKICAECGLKCTDHRIDISEPDKESICIVCLARAYFNQKKRKAKWYNKILSSLFSNKPQTDVIVSKRKIKVVPSVGETVTVDKPADAQTKAA